MYFGYIVSVIPSICVWWRRFTCDGQGGLREGSALMRVLGEGAMTDGSSGIFENARPLVTRDP